jgi:TP901 family phage tail tape measure protein
MAVEELRLGVDPRPAVDGFRSFREAADGVIQVVYTLEQVLGKIGVTVNGVAQAVAGTAPKFDNTGDAAQEAGQKIDDAGDRAETAGAQISDAGEKAASSWERVSNIDWQGIGRSLTISVGAPLTAVATASVAASESVFQSMQTIRRATGATGAELASLEASFRSLAGTVPNSFQDIAAALGDVNTRTGATGSALEDLTRKMLRFARVNNEDVATSTRNVGTLMNALELEAKDLPLILDQITLAAQRTGIGANDLARGLIDAGLNFQQLGFSTERAIALFAQFELVGARPADVIGSLNVALTSLARAGFTDANQAFEELLRQIREAPSILAATTIAADAFGARVGAKLAEEIRGGTFEVDNFVEALRGAGGVIEQTDDQSLGFTEQFRILRQQIALAIEPIGVSLVNAFQSLEPIIELTATHLGTLASGFAAMSEPVQATIIAVGALAVAMGPLVYAIGGIVKAAVGLKAFFASLAGMTVTTAGLVVGLKALAAAVVALAVIGGITALLHKWGSEAREAAERTVELAKALEEAKQAFQEIDADTASRAVLQFSSAMVDLTAQIDAQRESIAELEQAGLGDYEFQQLKQARAELEGMIQRRNELNQLYQSAAARLQTIRDGEQAVTAAAEGQLGTRREISRELELQEVSLVNVRTTLTGLLRIEDQLTRQLQDRTMLLTQRAKLEGELRTVQNEINGIFRTQMGLLRDVQATMNGISQSQKASLDDLLRGLELNTLTAQEVEQILQIEEGIRLTLAAGVSDLEERNALTEILLRLQGELGRAGEEAAYRTRDAWSQVLGFISSRVDGIIASFAQIGQQLMSGNLVGAGLGLLGTGLDALGIGKGSQEAAQAQERYNAALQRFVDMSRELTTFETGLRQIEDAFRQTVQSLMPRFPGLQLGSRIRPDPILLRGH